MRDSHGASEREQPLDRVSRLIREGHMTQEVVDHAVGFWRDQLRQGVRLPHRELVVISLDDLYHVLVDPRILRRVERIEMMLQGVFEIRTTSEGRQCALSRWSEQDQNLCGYIILQADSRLRTMHVVDEKRLERQARKGELLWRQ
jgi:hypothetical protein